MKSLLYRILFFLLISAHITPTTAQNQTKIDSLKKVIETANNDTTKVNVLNAISDALRKKGEYKDAMQYAKECLKLAKELNYKTGQADIINIIGVVHWLQNDYSQGLDNLKEASKIYKELGIKKGLANTYNNIGGIYYNQSDYPLALDYFFRSIKIQRELNDTLNENFTNAYNNIGSIYYSLSDYPLALNYFFKTLKIDVELLEQAKQSGNPDEVGRHKQNVAYSYGNIGSIYDKQSDYPRALDYHFKDLKIEEELGNKQGMAISYSNIGNLYLSLYEKVYPVGNSYGDTLGLARFEKDALLDTAMYYHQKALSIDKELDNKYGLTFDLSGIADIYFKKGEYSHALTYFQEATILADSIGALQRKSEAHSGLAECYEKLGSHKLALEHYKQYSTLKDSVFNEEKSKDIGKLEAGFEYDKKLALDQAEHEKQSAVAASESARQRVVIYAVSSGLLLLIVFFILLFNRFRIIRRQKKIIEEQKQVVDEKNMEITQKNKDITDSIRYAQNIQKAILPPIEEIKKTLPDSFVLFKPKDIVSGDFYFYAQVNQYTIIAACDCTGHGVPGAFMSMIGNSLLNEIVNDRSVTDAAEVLNQLRDGVIHAFGEAGTTGEQKDGMDMALISLEFQVSSSKLNTNDGIATLQYAGAYNPLYLIREGELQQIKADKQPVGYHFGKQTPFTNHRVQLHKGDTIYIFSDGYQDQFGGPRGKKFMSKRCRQLFIDIQTMNMEEQKEHLDKTIEDWKEGREQVDDILVIGIRV